MGDNDVGISVQKLTAPKQLSAWCIEKAPLDHNELTVHTLSNKSTYCPKLYDIFSIATGITIRWHWFLVRACALYLLFINIYW